MPHLLKSSLVALAVVLCRISLAGAAELPADVMPLSELRIGMKGEARSVFQGYDLDIYSVEIIGIENGALPGSAMILARVEGRGLDKHGIVAGMSGSPVFIDGKIIGALAYGWSFSYTPLAGITPIEHMLTMMDDITAPDPDKKKSARLNSLGALGAETTSTGWDWQHEWTRYSQGFGSSIAPEPVHFTPTSPAVRDLLDSDASTLEMQPLAAPLFVSGASPSSASAIHDFLAPYGLEVFAGGAGGGSNPISSEPAPPIQAGSALGIPIMTGDVTVSSMGTVTYRDGDKLLAFGHPMFAQGEVYVPMSQSYVFGYMQSYSRSFKLGQTREIVGSIVQDRQFGIGGLFGPAPERVPITVKAKGPASTLPREYNFSVWESEDFLPRMAGIALMESYIGSVSEGGEETADCHYVIRLEDGQTIEKNLRNSAENGPAMQFFSSLLQDMFLLINNPFQIADIASIEIDLESRPGFRVDALRRATPRYSRLKPGEALKINTVWRPFRGQEYERQITVDLPSDLSEGTYVVHVVNASTAFAIEQRHTPGEYKPEDLQEVIELAQAIDFPAQELHVYVFEPEEGVSLGDSSLAGAPDSIRTLVAETAVQEVLEPVTGRMISHEVIPFEFPLTGLATFTLEIDRYLHD